MTRRVSVSILIVATLAAIYGDFHGRQVWPSLVALAAVFLARSALGGLLIGAAVGSLMLTAGNPVPAFTEFFSHHLIPSLKHKWNLSVLIFTLLLGGFCALIESGRGLETLLRRVLENTAQSARRIQYSAFVLGLVCFFDGLASCLLTGRTVRPFVDRAGVSRAKLAYIVDSTGSAVASVAIMSTWIAFQLSMIQEGYKQAGITDVNAFAVFIRSIPLNFYSWFALLSVVLSIRVDWHPGPMAETEATPPEKLTTEEEASPGQLWRAAIPLMILIFGLPVGLVWSGADEHFTGDGPSIMRAFGAAHADDVLLHLSAIAGIAAWLCNRGRGVSRPHRAGNSERIFLSGVEKMFPPCLILVAAWCLSSTLRELGAAFVIVDMLSDRFPIVLLPLLVFLLGTLTSFTTGTSWGTMGLLMPLALPVAIHLAGPESQTVPAVVAAVFGGAVFGDHCSPLSDTTIVSALACGVDPLEHVRSQLPYALIAAGLAAVLGFLPAGLGMPGWIGLGAGAIALFIIAHRRPTRV
jgi:tetracycline resistance efflux pump